MMQVLLPIHILAGTIALIGAALAVSSEKGKKLHILSGKTYFLSMVAIFLTAIPMSILNSDIFFPNSYIFFLPSFCRNAFC